ncbi:MAG: dTDP-4-dehydrorhamnose reductase [Desulfobacter postgatei]|uniref:dTDP-4-dehydrorhamnose reductase n=1 Tax=Desulfobacter postgatei TaxID=2293 RepID=A0A2G6MSS6_9BACT|nr:MAG: dTDP-4-dehydrorhamnose reductase [Desulfobacter postgatei]
MKVLIIGSGGQLGWELLRTTPRGTDINAVDYPQVDFLKPDTIRDCIARHTPDWIINAAAYTAVDQAESDQENAYHINHEAVSVIARAAEAHHSRLAHISTDYIFSGRHYKPLQPDDPADPQSVYGMSKWKGETALLEVSAVKSLIIRTAWLYSAHGKNFVKTMLKLMTDGKPLNVIDEQVGTPTWAKGLAQAIWICIDKSISGTFHWTDAGAASWYDFAVAIQEEAITLDLLQTPVPITPVLSTQFPTPAQRPFYSILDKHSMWQATGITPVHWRVQLRAMLGELKE